MTDGPKKYFYCGSTQAVLYALADEDYIIISSTIIAKKLCRILQRELIDINVDVNIKSLIKHPLKIKNEIDRLVLTLRGNELHFSHSQFAVFCFILTNEVSKTDISVFFHDFEFLYNENISAKLFFETFFKNIKCFIKKKIIELLYNIDLSFKEMSGMFLIAIDNDFLNNRKVKIIRNDFYKKTLKLFINFPNLKKTYRYIYLTQNLLNNNLFESESLIALFEYLSTKNINVKLHPGMKEKEAVFFENKIISNEDLPAEFFFNSVTHAIISVHSSALITAAKFEHLKSISLLGLLKPLDPIFFKKVKRDLVVKSANSIYFPSSFKELDSLLSD